MLGFIISTIAFSIAVYALNRHFDAQSRDSSQSRKILIMSLATAFSIGVGWVVDKLDGDADRPHPSVATVVQSGDPIQVIKLLAGMN